MKKIIITLIIAVVLIVGYFLLSPLFRTERVMEDFPTTSDQTQSKDRSSQDEAVTISEGRFVGTQGHDAKGMARLVEVQGKKFIRFEDDFEITNGPDLLVYLGRDNEYDKEAVLGDLKGNVGSQNYEIPASINIDNYNEVWVWCRAFSTPFGKTELR